MRNAERGLKGLREGARETLNDKTVKDNIKAQ
jgi:hypothetical protein